MLKRAGPGEKVPTPVQMWLDSLVAAVGAQDGKALRSQLELDPARCSAPLPLHELARAAGGSMSAAIRAALRPPWRNVARMAAEASLLDSDGSPQDAFSKHKIALEAALSAFESAQDNTFGIVLVGVARDCVRIADGLPPRTTSDNAIHSLARKPLKRRLTFLQSKKMLETIIPLLRRAFQACMVHRARDLELTKKRTAFHLAVLMLRTYFRLSQIKQCRSALDPLENSARFPFDVNKDYPPGPAASFNYYKGSCLAMEDKCREANDALTRAWAACRGRHPVNARRIMAVLVPVRIHMGQLPTGGLLREHGLDELYGPLVAAFRTGHLGNFDKELARTQAAHFKLGTYLLVERAALLVQRNLVRRCAYAAGKKTAKSRLVPIVAVQVAYQWAGRHLSVGEVECMLANLIYCRLVGGKVAHAHGKLVLAATKGKDFPIGGTFWPVRVG